MYKIFKVERQCNEAIIGPVYLLAIAQLGYWDEICF